jgi:hypothetical protein
MLPGSARGVLNVLNIDDGEKVMRLLCLSFMILFVSAMALAQNSDFHRHNLAAGIGPAIPAGETTSYLSAAPLIRLAYGYRFNRFLQADAGFQMAFGAANNQNAVQTEIGPVQGGDHEFMFPLGGRVIIPQPFKKFEISAGGGVVYLHYSETATSNGFYSPTCYSCTSRGGWGGYGLGAVNYFLDENKTFHLGSTFEFISASTSGSAVGNVPAVKTTDHWANLSFELGLSF